MNTFYRNSFEDNFQENKDTDTVPPTPPNKPLSKVHPVQFVLAQNNSSIYDKIITNISQHNYILGIQMCVSNICCMFRSYGHDLVELIYTYWWPLMVFFTCIGP